MAAARVVMGFMKRPLSTLAVGRLTIGLRLNDLPHKRLTRWNWLSFWSLLKTKGRIGFVSFFCFGFVQGSPPGFGRCDKSRLFRFRVTLRNIWSVWRRSIGYVFRDPASRYGRSERLSMAAAETCQTDWRWAFVFSSWVVQPAADC